jgi:hypothetical protein
LAIYKAQPADENKLAGAILAARTYIHYSFVYVVYVLAYKRNASCFIALSVQIIVLLAHTSKSAHTALVPWIAIMNPINPKIAPKSVAAYTVIIERGLLHS